MKEENSCFNCGRFTLTIKRNGDMYSCCEIGKEEICMGPDWPSDFVCNYHTPKKKMKEEKCTLLEAINKLFANEWFEAINDCGNRIKILADSSLGIKYAEEKRWRMFPMGTQFTKDKIWKKDIGTFDISSSEAHRLMVEENKVCQRIIKGGKSTTENDIITVRWNLGKKSFEFLEDSVRWLHMEWDGDCVISKWKQTTLIIESVFVDSENKSNGFIPIRQFEIQNAILYFISFEETEYQKTLSYLHVLICQSEMFKNAPTKEEISKELNHLSRKGYIIFRSSYWDLNPLSDTKEMERRAILFEKLLKEKNKS